jgi:hypothetical protein
MIYPLTIESFWPKQIISRAKSFGYCIQSTSKLLKKIFEKEILDLNIHSDTSRSEAVERITADVITWLEVHAAIDPIVNSLFIQC